MNTAAMRRAPAFSQVRIARPVRDLDRAQRQYCDGLGLKVLDRFEGHDGFDGIMLGIEGAGWHFEFTRHHSHAITPAPTVEDLVVFYVDDPQAFEAACQRMLDAGFRESAAFNPYWNSHGRTFEDGDGYRVVLNRGPAG